MSGECDDCGEHTLDCFCHSEGEYVLARTCGPGCPCNFNEHNPHLNLLGNGNDEVRHINVRGRLEQEAIIRDREWCDELGLDQIYETIAYLRRWGNWLSQN